MNRIRPMSKKRASLQRKYQAFVAGMLAVDDRCKVGPRISRVDRRYHKCLRRANGLHHLRKKSAQGALMDPDNVLACCDPCNGWIEDHPTLAEQAGLVIRAGHPDFDRLGQCHTLGVR